jgi:hypothetical protein
MLKKHGTYIEISGHGGVINRKFYDTLFSEEFQD